MFSGTMCTTWQYGIWLQGFGNQMEAMSFFTSLIFWKMLHEFFMVSLLWSCLHLYSKRALKITISWHGLTNLNSSVVCGRPCHPAVSTSTQIQSASCFSLSLLPENLTNRIDNVIKKELNSLSLHVLDSRTAFLDPTSSKIPINSVLQTSLQKPTKTLHSNYLSIHPSIHPSFSATSIAEVSSNIILLLWGASTRPLGLKFFLVFYLKLLLLRNLSLLGNFGNFWIASEIHKVSMAATKNGLREYVYKYIHIRSI